MKYNINILLVYIISKLIYGNKKFNEGDKSKC